MSYTSCSFLLFIICTSFFYYILPSKMRKYVLLVGSIIFYAASGIPSLIICVVSTVISYGAAIIIGKPYSDRIRTTLLLSVVTIDISILLYSKYLSTHFEWDNIVIPLGISFYTLSLLAYLFDIYRKAYLPELNPLKFILVVMFFPHISQGPIVRYNILSRYFEDEVCFDYKRVSCALQLMLWGYIKKMVIADRAAIFVNAVYDDVDISGGTVLFLASLLYSIQIYMDFSGCVDISIGMAEIFGVKLMSNFRQPYLSNSIKDFWHRWHISLSTWFRDYIYIPLGGNRKGKLRRIINLIVVFLVSGIWHGAGLNFMLWGILHGMYQIVGEVLLPIRRVLVDVFSFNTQRRAFKIVKVLFTFFLINFAWIFFRISDVKKAFFIIKTIVTKPTPWVLTDGSLVSYGIDAPEWLILILFILFALFIDVVHEKGYGIRRMICRQHILVRWGVYNVAILAIVIFGVYGNRYVATNFIYMGF